MRRARSSRSQGTATDAAHELRTPIAAIRAQAQVALGAAADEERVRALQATLQGCDRATRLVEQLLTLSRLESGSQPPLATLDLVPLARQVVADAVASALARGQDIELRATGPCPVRGDATLLSVLLRNLVDNAVRYSPANARVSLAVERQGAAVQLRLEDSGPGLSQAEMDRLGERFFRVLGGGQEGSGLGWSIVRRIAAVHGAEITVACSMALGGLAVRLAFPAEPAA